MVGHTLLNINYILFAKHMTCEHTDTFTLQVISRNNCIMILVLTIILMFHSGMIEIWILLLFPSPDSVIL